VLVRIERVVIVGGGLAGLRTAAELRAREYQGTITMIGAERHPPYDRPPLSKKLMLGELDSTSMADEAAGLDLDLRLGETAVGLADGVVRTDQAECWFDRLVVATGAAPVRLPGDGPQQVLRTIDDALAIRAALRPGTRLVIIGAGWIGAELATAAAARGCQVTVLEAADTPAVAALGAEAGAQLVPWYAAAGVDLRLGQPVESVQAGGLALPGGGWLAADLVVTAVGVRPSIGWLADSGVDLGNGVLVDAGLRASVPGVFAAGDCAAFWSRRFGQRLRVEHWDTALHAPAVAAANMLGGEEEYDPVPYFWSEQFGRTVQFAGQRGPDDQLIWRGDPAAPRWTACWVAKASAGEASASAVSAGGFSASEAGAGAADGAGRLVAVLTVGQPRDLLQGRRVIGAGRPVDLARLADPAVPLRETTAR
jgi:3-phenylpropionate/trans-cinnamate dioxygenase ferredoxin reductase component